MKHLALLAAAALVLTGCASQTPPPVSDRVQAYYDESVKKDAQPRAVTPVISELLALTTKPLTISVLGDSTSAESDGWVTLTGEWIGDKYNRTVQITTYDAKAKKYPAPTVLHQGKGSAVTIYNGSIPGTRSDQADLKTMVPGPAPILWINYGHNHGPDAWPAIAETTRRAASITGTAAKNVVIIGQNPAIGDALHEAKVRGVLAGAKKAGYTTVDVFTAFTKTPDMDSLYLDVRHPSPAGSQVWATAVEAVLSKS